MIYRRLGQTDIEISAVIFGAWAIGGWWWGPSDDDVAERAVRMAVDLGINCVDTAPMYGCGRSEQIVGRAIKGIRDKVVVATKCGLRWDRTDGEYHFSSSDPVVGPIDVYKVLKPDSIREECERSLRRLGVDCIDLYQCHWPDSTTNIDDTMAELVDLRRRGKIRHIGVSNFSPELISQSLKTARVESDQPRYNLLDRSIESEIVPLCINNEISLIVYSPLAQGLLTGKVTKDRKFNEGDLRPRMPLFSPDNIERVQGALDRIKPLKDKYDKELSQLVINWTINQPGITGAIVGARNPDQVKENAAGADFQMEPEDLESVARAFRADNKSE